MSAGAAARPARPARPGRRGPPAGAGRRVAASDIGSNSIRQIVADVSPDGTIRVVDEMKAQPRLGAGMDGAGALQPKAMESALRALARMGTLARQLGAERVEAVATSAVRDAANGREFLDRVEERTGLRVRLLEGDEEARLAFRSALAHFELGAGRAVVADIGGGSLELALAADGVVERLLSLPLGALRLTERHLADGTRRKAVRALRAAVRGALRQAVAVRDFRRATFIGSGGTFTNLAAIALARRGVPTARTVHGTTVAQGELERILEWLQEMTEEERRRVPGLNPQRADIIVAGLAVAAELTARFHSRELVVSAYGIREGLLLETARVAPSAADPGEARDRSVREFAERCHYEAPHATQVRRLALQLFDAIGERLGCAPADRQVLADAALLHDVGYHINYEKHHKHSYHLILHAELLGMRPEEQVALANVARYHRGARPKRKHRNFGDLDEGLRERITRLAALLRVADGFDRGHVGAVDRLKVRWLAHAVRIAAVPSRADQPIRLELWGAARKSELLAAVADRKVEIVGPDGAAVRADEDDG